VTIAWLVFMLIVGRALATGAAFADQAASAARRPRRFLWLAGLIATAAWPLLALGILHLAQEEAFARGWDVGVPGHAPMIVLTVPTWVGPSWLDRSFFFLWGLTSTVLLARLAVLAYRLGNWQRSLPLVEVDGVPVRLARDVGPAVVGVRAMDVVLPTWALALEPSCRRLVLSHEQQHLQARDPSLIWIAAIVTALVPWNLFVWWQASRLRLAVELDCDARVLHRDPRPLVYARLLLQIAERSSSTTSSTVLAPALVERATRLEYRLAAIRARHDTIRPSRGVAYTLAATGAVVLACAIRAPTLPYLFARFDAHRTQDIRWAPFFTRYRRRMPTPAR